MKKVLIFFSFALIALSCSSNSEYDFYISPNGNDNNPGTINEPFATVDKARLAVRELKKAKEGNIKVGLKGGKYVLRNTLIFSLDDSGSESQKITYKAVEGEEPVLTSENPVTGWIKEEKISDAFPTQAEGKIWSAPLPEGAGRVKYLFQSNKALPRSMTRGFVPPVKYRTWAGINDQPETRTSMKIPGGIISDWQDVEDKELVIIPTCDWTLYNRPLVSYDAQTQIAETNLEEFYALGQITKSNWNGTTSAWIANCPEGMLEEGNWYVNTRENKLYLFSSDEPADINVPMLVEYIRVKGEKKPEGENDVLVENIHFEGLVFTNGKRYTWQGGAIKDRRTYYDVPNSLLKFQNAKNCSVTECAFENSGGAAIYLEQSAQNNCIKGNIIRRIGGAGIQISGYQYRKDSNSGNIVEDNHIHHNGEAYWGAPAISITQASKNRVAHNLIHHTPYNAIRLSGSISGDNAIEYNEIYRAVDILGDGNAFYVVAGGEKNRFQYNYVHDIISSHASSGLRTDGVGSSKNVIFVGNVLHNIHRGGLVFKGKGHKAINNIFIDCAGNALDKSWEGGRGWFEIRCGRSDDMVIKNNIFYATFNKSPLFMNANSNESMPQRFRNAGLIIEFDKIEQEGNICYSSFLDEAETQKLAQNSVEKGFQLDYKKITAISIEDGKVHINPDDQLFKEG
ncbi:MAG: right-handed parallel beta-helix repeat-containing protein, partial [Bacteroides sp.]|nr:right-handed parallel beta-helix repeat-containing protein [Bacteroides sp.]